jgi:eukaryotic-like serine/threonine-protein kinase
VKKSLLNNNIRWLGIGGIILLALIFSGFGLNYLINNLPVPTGALSPTKTATPELPTLTNVPFTLTLQPTETLTLTPTPGIGSTMTGADGATLVYVPAGKFIMGIKAEDALAICQKYHLPCQLGWYKDEQPPHEIDLSAYWIDQTEVTNAMYAKCVSDNNKCQEPKKLRSETHSSYYGNPEFDNYPVIYVDWKMASTYCSWAGRSLPTEAQWEKAARGTDGNIYPWGNTFDGTKVNFCDSNCSNNWANKSFNDGYADVSPVGNYPLGQSIYGALDMAGNVWEWVNDWYDVYPGGDPSASNNFGQKYRVLRGGTWGYNLDSVRSAFRLSVAPDSFATDVGFRCAWSP